MNKQTIEANLPALAPVVQVRWEFLADRIVQLLIFGIYEQFLDFLYLYSISRFWDLFAISRFWDLFAISIILTNFAIMESLTL